MQTDEPIVIEETFDQPVQALWTAITDAEQMKHWYFQLETFRPEVGFTFQFVGGAPEKPYVHICKVTEVVDLKKLAYTWRYEGYEGESLVSFELFPAGGQTRLILTHARLGSFPKNNPDLAKENFREGWKHIIGKSLKDFMQTKP